MSSDYRKLEVWKKAHSPVLETYKTTKNFPKSEWSGIISQMRRSVVSIPANIVEGATRKSSKEYIHFLQIALSSSNELGYFVFLSYELHFFDNKKYKELENMQIEISKMLQGLIKCIDATPKTNN